jgi:transcriptional antiterminator RfaH
MLGWYLILAKPSVETNAQINLERQNYEVYCPWLLQAVRLAGRWMERIAALFPRYLFVRLAEGRHSLGPVGSTVGVAAIVRFGQQYATVPDEIVQNLQNLRERADPQSGLHRLVRQSPFLPRSPVRITSGPFDGLEGVFERKSGSEHIVVLLKLLGQDAAVRVPAGLGLPAITA